MSLASSALLLTWGLSIRLEMSATIVWFRNDLRLADNPALFRALEKSEAVIPLFIWAPEEEEPWAPGGAHRWWLHSSLESLKESLKSIGSDLIIRRGSSLNVLREVINETNANAVFWNQGYLPALRDRDSIIDKSLSEEGVTARRFSGRLLHDPELIRTGSDKPYRVFTPFWKNLQASLDIAEPLPAPSSLPAPGKWPATDPLGDLELTAFAQDHVDWASQIRAFWRPGESGANDRLDAFVDEALIDYATRRNRPDKTGSSLLSPYLHHGELSPRQVWQKVNAWVQNAPMREAANSFLSEIGWREFAYHSLWHFPALPNKPLREKYAGFGWTDDAEQLRRWQQGRTGYPMVDAGMRQLWALGWMHNRVRMIVGSFLTKHLLIHWKHGQDWFWDTLVDGDLANNALNWQWVAGSGPDAQPFFRIFNPITQGERYDPEGAYVREWIPELRDLPTKYIHKPWEASPDVLENAGIVLGTTYPEPIVDHAQARKRALDALELIK